MNCQDASNVARWARRRERSPLPRQHLVHSLRNDPEPRQGPPPPGHVPAAHPEYCVRLHGLTRAKVLMDPFLGLGSSPLPPPNWESISWESRSIATTWRKRSRESELRCSYRLPATSSGLQLSADEKSPVLRRQHRASNNVAKGQNPSGASERGERAARSARAGEAARESACRGVQERSPSDKTRISRERRAESASSASAGRRAGSA